MTYDINRKITAIAVASALLALVVVIVSLILYFTVLRELYLFSGLQVVISLLLLGVIAGGASGRAPDVAENYSHPI